jgi:hypothetical protein
MCQRAGCRPAQRRSGVLHPPPRRRAARPGRRGGCLSYRPARGASSTPGTARRQPHCRRSGSEGGRDQRVQSQPERLFGHAPRCLPHLPLGGHRSRVGMVTSGCVRATVVDACMRNMRRPGPACVRGRLQHVPAEGQLLRHALQVRRRVRRRRCRVLLRGCPAGHATGWSMRSQW